MKNVIIHWLVLLLCSSIHAQINTPETQLKELLQLANMLREEKPIIALQHARQAIALADSLGDKLSLSKSYYRAATILQHLGEYKIAENYLLEALAIQHQLGAHIERSATLNLLGLIYYREDFQKSLEYFLAALSLSDSLQQDTLKDAIYLNLSSLYQEKKDFRRAELYLREAFRIDSISGNLKNMGQTINNLANNYWLNGDMINAQRMYLRAMELSIEAKDSINLAAIYNNMGNINIKIKKYDVGLIWYFKSLAIKIRRNDQSGECKTLTNIGAVYFSMGKLDSGIKYTLDALKIAKSLNDKVQKSSIYRNLSLFYDKKGDPSKALEYYRLFYITKDSLYNENIQHQTSRMQAIFDFQRKEKEIELLNEKRKLQELELQRAAVWRYSLMGGVILLAILAVLAYSRYLIKYQSEVKLQHQNEEIQLKNTQLAVSLEEIKKQKDIIAQQHEAITDSITYSQRIQRSLLPTHAQISEIVSTYALLYKPRDIVSGDFYWLESKAGKAWIALGDCTGHGVPGALMSVMACNLLNQLVFEFPEMSPAQHLYRLNELVVRALHQQTGTTDSIVADGMDIAFLYRLETYKWVFAGSGRPVWLCRNNEIIEIKGARYPIGGIQHKNKEFIDHVLDLQTGDRIILFSDGITDQTGGIHRKKFTGKQLRQFFMDNAGVPTHQLAEKLNDTLIQWQSAAGMHQIDDMICWILEV